jgi:hypothetical protein
MLGGGDHTTTRFTRLGCAFNCCSHRLSECIFRRPPLLGTVNTFEIEEKAGEKLKDHPESFGYVFGSAGTFRTNKANLEAFDRWRIMQVDSIHALS